MLVDDSNSEPTLEEKVPDEQQMENESRDLGGLVISRYRGTERNIIVF